MVTGTPARSASSRWLISAFSRASCKSAAEGDGSFSMSCGCVMTQSYDVARCCQSQPPADLITTAADGQPRAPPRVVAMESVTRVEVPGGALAVEVISAASEPVLAVHGISSQRRLWNWLRAADPSLSLIAPDLRGRGDSVDVAGPSSVAQHAADMVAGLDRLGLDSVHVCGMSMGGFVGVELATAWPGRVKSLILVDGGFPMTVPPGMTREKLPAIFRARLARLDRDWAPGGG